MVAADDTDNKKHRSRPSLSVCLPVCLLVSCSQKDEVELDRQKTIKNEEEEESWTIGARG